MRVSWRLIGVATIMVLVAVVVAYGVAGGESPPATGVSRLLGELEFRLQQAASSLQPKPPAQPKSPATLPTMAPLKAEPTYTVRRGGISQTVIAPARVVAAGEVLLYFRTAGQLDELPVKIGDRVRQGDVLAQLMGRYSREQQVAQAQLNLEVNTLRLARATEEAAREEAIRNDLTTAQAAAEQAELTLQNAKLKLERLKKAPSPEDITVAKGTLEKARVALRRAQAAYDKVYWQVDIGASKEAADLESATIDYNIALASYNLKVAGPSREDLAMAENEVKSAEISLARAKADYEQKKVFGSLKHYDVLLAQKEVERGRLALEQLDRQAADARILVPFSGTVAGIAAKPGDPVPAFSPVIRLADPSILEVLADIDDATLAAVKDGQKATLTFDQRSGQEFSATVALLPGAGDLAAGGRSVRLRLDAQADLALGMQGQVGLVLQKKDNALVVSREAVRPSGTRTYARVQRGDVVEQVEVRIGIQNEDMVEILSGLKEGDQVVLR